MTHPGRPPTDEACAIRESLAEYLNGTDPHEAGFRRLAAHSPRYARAEVERILEAIDQLEEFPDCGRVVPEYVLTTPTNRAADSGEAICGTTLAAYL